LENYEDIQNIITNLPIDIKVIITTHNPRIQDRINSIKWQTLTIEPFNHNESLEYFKKQLNKKNFKDEDLKKLINALGDEEQNTPLSMNYAVGILIDSRFKIQINR
jgi:myo-inositol catabolism protein IolC